MIRLGVFRRTVPRLAKQRRFFSAETQHKNSPPPPPPEKGGSGLWILLTGALLGGGYYFKDELVEFGGWSKEDNTVKKEEKVAPEAEVKEIKETIKKAEEVLKPKSEEAAKKVKSVEKTATKVDWNKLREDIADLLPNETFPDGSSGPTMVRLAWHSAGTYDKKTKTGGSEGAGMRFKPEAAHGANAGLHRAREILAPLKEKYPDVSYSDLWSLAGTVAIEEMGGPAIKWRPGRSDFVEGENVVPDGRLPNADDDNLSAHIRKIFNRMGFNDQEIVALLGAHALGRGYPQNSGYSGPWTFSPITFSNEYYRLLVEEKWTVKKTEANGKLYEGPVQYTDKTNELMMLPADMELINDKGFKKWVEVYAKDEEKFFTDFSKAWIKLQENGVKKFQSWSWRQYFSFW